MLLQEQELEFERGLEIGLNEVSKIRATVILQKLRQIFLNQRLKAFQHAVLGWLVNASGDQTRTIQRDLDHAVVKGAVTAKTMQYDLEKKQRELDQTNHEMCRLHRKVIYHSSFLYDWRSTYLKT